MFDEPGLLHTGKTAGQQHRRIKREQKALKRAGITIEPITASQYAVAKYGGIVDIDQTLAIDSKLMPADWSEFRNRERTRNVARTFSTTTRFVQYPRANIGNSPHCMDSSNMVASEFIEPTWSLTRRVNIGVRRVAIIAVSGAVER